MIAWWRLLIHAEIAWWWLIPALAVGFILGLIVIAVCAVNPPECPRCGPRHD